MGRARGVQRSGKWLLILKSPSVCHSFILSLLSNCRKASNFKFPPTLVEEVGYQIYIFSKFNIWKILLDSLIEFIGKFRRFPLKCSNFANFLFWMDAGMADPHFPKCHIRAVCVWGGGGQQKYGISNFLGQIFLTAPLYLHTEMFSLGTEEEIKNCTLTTRFERITMAIFL